MTQRPVNLNISPEVFFFLFALSTKIANGNYCLVALGHRSWLQNNKY